MQILPGMSDILSILPSVNPRLQQPCLQFTYWSIVYMEQTVQGSQVPNRTKHNGIFQHRSVTGLTTLCLKCVSNFFPLNCFFVVIFAENCFGVHIATYWWRIVQTSGRKTLLLNSLFLMYLLRGLEKLSMNK